VTPTLEADPDCARPGIADPARLSGSDLRVLRCGIDDIAPATWDELAARNPWATPFSTWAFQRAWWDAYAPDAHEQTLLVERAGDPIAIAPLMHRHAVEPGDEVARTALRHGAEPELTIVPATAKAIYFGASYHADYATVLARPSDQPDVAHALAGELDAETRPGPEGPEPWDVVDLRRLRTGDPAVDALAAALGARGTGEGWTLNLEREDVCPVATLPETGGFDAFLAGLDKKERHEIRRKVRRAAAAGDVELAESAEPLADLGAFIDLHQRRWGAEGLFPPTTGGDQSRRFVRRLVECFAERLGTGCGETTHASLHLSFLTVGGRRVAAALHFETADSLLYYNAGIDPDARALSPGVVLTERLVRLAIERGKRRFDFLRGDEPYKYEWGARDEPIQRLLVRRRS
jgi:CelD/BcsL family acetyltransferase involved in cellulose biosynthesis